MSSRRTATIQDVARAAGVSTATVSRVMSNPEIVAQSTRTAVEEAIRDIGYRVHHSARNLRRQRTGSIVALVPNIANPFFSQILSGVALTLRPRGYNLLIADTRSGPGGDMQMLQSLGNGVADGIVLFDGGVQAHLFDPTRKERQMPPVVLACEWIEGLDLPRVRADNETGAALAVEHLVSLGHRRLGHLAGPEGNVLTVGRLEGMRRALSRHGLDLPTRWVFKGDFTLDSGAFAAREWLGMEDRPEALFCASDEMACGFIGAVHAAGVRVPEDVSVVGFDNIELVAHITPALTTIRQQRMQIGVEAARMILAQISGKPLPRRDLLLPVELIVRQSTAAPRR